MQNLLIKPIDTPILKIIMIPISIKITSSVVAKAPEERRARRFQEATRIRCFNLRLV